MKENIFLKLIASLPAILLGLYFIPFLGICQIILRYFIYNKKKRISTPIIFIILGMLIIILNYIPNFIDNDFADLIRNYITNDILKFGKCITCVGIILVIISYISNGITTKLINMVKYYIDKSVKQDVVISEKNDLKIKEKQIRAKNTSYVKCPYCGSDNLVGEKFETCKYCRRKIENKSYNS